MLLEASCCVMEVRIIIIIIFYGPWFLWIELTRHQLSPHWKDKSLWHLQLRSNSFLLQCKLIRVGGSCSEGLGCTEIFFLKIYILINSGGNVLQILYNVNLLWSYLHASALKEYFEKLKEPWKVSSFCDDFNWRDIKIQQIYYLF